MSRLGRNELCPCGSGLKYKKCCLQKYPVERLFDGPEYGNPRLAFLDDLDLVFRSHKRNKPLHAIERVGVHYSFPEQFGEAHVSYHFPTDRMIFLEWGQVVTAGQLRTGMRFQMEGGQIATVTRVEIPEWWQPPEAKAIRDNLYRRRVIGRVEHVGHVVMDVFFGGGLVTTTPDHLWYSATRQCYIPAARLRAGEMLVSPENETIRCDGISAPRHGLIKLYNIEVEQFHNYFVGSHNAAALVHNGVPGAGGCGVPKPLEVEDVLVGTKAYKKGWSGQVVLDHRLSRAVAKVFGGNPNAHLVLEALEANARKGAREGQLLASFFEYVRGGVHPVDALEVLRPELEFIINDVHARPVNPRVFRKVPAEGSR